MVAIPSFQRSLSRELWNSELPRAHPSFKLMWLEKRFSCAGEETLICTTAREEKHYWYKT